MSGPRTIDGWRGLGAVAPADLVSARLSLHWAAQIVSAAGSSWLPAADDFSHTALLWDHGLAGLTSQELFGGLRAGLRFETLELVLLDKEGGELDALPLASKTLDEGLGWLAAALSERLGEARELTRPTHDLPEHPAGQGEPFAVVCRESAGELARWFGNAARALTPTVDAVPTASPLRCWPHHFDIATLITLVADEDAEKAKSVGVGMTPGDGSYAEPYVYVTPWPYPDGMTLLELPAGGRWHMEGWFGAVLTGTRLLERSEPVGQGGLLLTFLDAAVAACREMLRSAD